MSLEITIARAPDIAESTTGPRPNLLARIAAWMNARRRRRQDVRQLLAMDAHMLTDLGITRAYAEYLAQQPFAGDCSGALFRRRQR